MGRTICKVDWMRAHMPVQEGKEKKQQQRCDTTIDTML